MLLSEAGFWSMTRTSWPDFSVRWPTEAQRSAVPSRPSRFVAVETFGSQF